MNEQLCNFENYGPYKELVETGTMTIIVSNINKGNYNDHFYGILNILRDGIELQEVQSMFVNVVFKPGVSCKLSIIDFMFNLMMWNLLIRTNQRIKPKHIFFDMYLTQSSIKDYIDNYLIDMMRDKIDNRTLNNIIDDTIVKYRVIEEFALYLANTINLEDTIELMDKCPEFNELMNFDFTKVPLEDMKDVGMDVTHKIIDIIIDSKKYLGHDHCLANNFRASQGISDKQYREFNSVIASKPNGLGGIFPIAIANSFINGGVNNPKYYFIESSAARTAQILGKINVGDSGHFARLLGLNNQDSFLHHDPRYVCDTKNFEEIYISSKTMLAMLRNKYYRLAPDGPERKINKNDDHLIGKKIYLRSPMTCASAARGEGVCYRCYGDLAYINYNINIGKIAAELLSSKLTQRMLSAKHLLETIINKVVWSPKMYDYFEIESNIISILPDLNTKGLKLIINPDDITLSNDYDDSDDDYDESATILESYNESITEFYIKTETDELIHMTSENKEKLYITNELNEAIRKHGTPDNGCISVPLSALVDKDGVEVRPVFLTVIMNNDLNKTLDMLMEVINKNSVTESMDRNSFLQTFMETLIEGNLFLNSSHCEVMLMNQLRAVDDILAQPDWTNKDEPSRVIALRKALLNNPSITNTLSYQNISSVLYNPLTFRKNKASFMDLFFMEKPQEYLSSEGEIREEIKESDVEQNLIDPIGFFESKDSDIEL